MSEEKLTLPLKETAQVRRGCAPCDEVDLHALAERLYVLFQRELRINLEREGRFNRERRF